MGCTKIFLQYCRFCPDNKSAALPAFNLQLFAGEKTEEATPKRKEEARQKGQVARSMELNSVFVIVAAFLTLKILGSYLYGELANYMKYIFSNLSMADLTIVGAQQLFITFALVFLKTTMPVMLIIVTVALAINFAQVGFNFTMEPLMPNFNKINPISGFGRLFSKRSLVELAKALLKIVVVSGFVYRFMMNQTKQIPELINAELTDALHLVAVLIVDLVFNISAVLFIMAVFDYIYQWWENQEGMKMSKEDIKQEFKQAEGDPHVKGKIKERQRAMAMQRMMKDVPKADVVVTNPTHFAVALKYDPSMAAPMVLAKGQDLVAQRIKDIAKEHKVVIVENKILARALYSMVEVGQAVPQDLYQAVAEVLAYVYKLKKKML